MALDIVYAYDRSDEVLSLFSEYMDMLLEGDPTFAAYLQIQNYDDELRDLSHKYGLPDGRLYLAYWDGELAGSIALRKIDDENCELKRLYIKPKFRRNGIAKALVLRLIDDAREIGYRYMLLDTLPFLTEAISLYESIGFCRTEKHNDSPLPAEKNYFYSLDL